MERVHSPPGNQELEASRSCRRAGAMLERFDEDARNALERARELAVERGDGHRSSAHILLGLMDVESGTAAVVLRRLKVDREDVLEQIRRSTAGAPKLVCPGLPYSPLAKQILTSVLQEATRPGHPLVGTGSLLAAIVSVGEGIAASALKGCGVTKETVLVELARAQDAASRGDGAGSGAVEFQ